MTSYQKHMIVFTFALVVVFAVLGYLDLLKSLNLIELVGGVAIGYVFCLIPDIDHPNSKIRHETTLILNTLTIVCLFIYILVVQQALLLYFVVMFTLIQLFMLKMKHRGFTHKIIFGALISAPIAYVSLYAGGLAFLGFISHLFAD